VSERSNAVRLVGATKTYGDFAAADHVDLEIRERELFTLLGPSGSGKTTVLRMIAGLIKPTSGQIWIGDREVHELATYERDIAMVFQSLALFPHLSVFGNVAFPLQMRRVGRQEIRRRVEEALEVVRLPGLSKRAINELSGGQQQRVALARALVYQPKLLLLDEPLGALDRRLREEMQLELVRLHQDLDVTIINVTHDQREALMLSDRIGVMRAGHLEQVGTSSDMYLAPRTRFVAEFLGDANLLDGVVESVDPPMIRTAGGQLLRAGDLGRRSPGDPVSLVVRAEVLRVGARGGSLEGDNRLEGTIALRAFEGATVYYEVAVPGLPHHVKVSASKDRAEAGFERDEAVSLVWWAGDTPVVGGGDP